VHIGGQIAKPLGCANFHHDPNHSGKNWVKARKRGSYGPLPTHLRWYNLCSQIVVVSRNTLPIVLLVCARLLSAQNEFATYEYRDLPEYQRTLKALERYRKLAAEDDGAILPSTKKPVDPENHYSGVPRLIRLLRLLGDLPAGTASDDSDVYTGELVAAVKRFQTRHGLEPDGRIGKATLAALNTPLSFRVRQLELALERWRRLPYDPSRPAILLNLPEFRLRAFNAGHAEPALEMKIIDGRAGKRRTPILASQVEIVLFRPYWNVPRSIQRNELVPQIRKNPGYIAKNEFDIVTPGGVVVATQLGKGADDLIAQLRSGKLLLRQRPGPKNALGLVKFEFPNPYNVYMHDTPAKHLFAKARRDFSHGCIRLEHAADLAEWLLRDQNGWTRENIEAAMQGEATFSVKLKHPVPVMTMYLTAVVSADGEVYFYNDIYGDDAALERELAAEASPTSGEPGLHPRE